MARRCTPWIPASGRRCDAECSPERGFYHSSSRQSAGQPIVAGWSYAWLAQLSFTHESWTAPLDVRRVPVHGDAHAVAAAQMRELVGRQAADAPVPLCVLDAGYDIGTLAHDLGDLDGTHVAVLVGHAPNGRGWSVDRILWEKETG